MYGSIKNASSKIEYIKILDKYILCMKIIPNKYNIEVEVQMILKIFLLFLLIIGLFSVSAGAYLNMIKVPNIEIIIIIEVGITNNLINIGTPIKINIEEIQQCQDLDACTPKPVALNKL